MLVGSAGVAAAGPYMGFAVGPSPVISNDGPAGVFNAGVLTFDANSRSGRLLAGYRFSALSLGAISIEGALTAYSLTGDNLDYGGRQAMISGKYNYPLGGGIEVFGRLGMHHTWITTTRENERERSGNGYLVGAGFEYRFKLPMAQASLWVDLTYNPTTIEELNFTRDYAARMWMLGFTFGI